MQKRWLSFLIVSSTLLSASAATAQDKGQTGVVMGYPTSVGMMWHVSDGLALRPELNLSKSTTESTTGVVQVTSGWTVGVGLSVLFYVRRWDNLSAYFSPRFSYARTENTIRPSSAATMTNETVNSNSSIAGLFGAQYALSRKFSAFGEVGPAFGTATNTYYSFASGSSKTTGHTWSTRTGVGVVFYF